MCHALAPLLPECLQKLVEDFVTIGRLPDSLLTRVPRADIPFFVSNGPDAAVWVLLTPALIRVELDIPQIIDRLIRARRCVTMAEEYQFDDVSIDWIARGDGSGFTLGITGRWAGVPVWHDIFLKPS